MKWYRLKRDAPPSGAERQEALMKTIEALRQTLYDALPRRIFREEEPLARHTSFRIGGPAELMAFPTEPAQLQALLRLAHEAGVAPHILGAGTNVLAPDAGLRGLTICLRDCLIGLELLDGTHISAMAGVSLAKTALFAAADGLSGMETLHGIPGTVGGAVFMNAGAYGGEMKDVVESVDFLHPDGRMERFAAADCAFGYRTSVFQTLPGVIVRAVFRLRPGEPDAIRAKISELAEKRRAAQPLSMPSAGSAFRRPQIGYAAALIEQTGLKGLTVGGASVSEKHAGFIVNNGGATAQDVLTLIREIQKKVLDATGVRLEPEVRLWE